jgi:hypothetical protein
MPAPLPSEVIMRDFIEGVFALGILWGVALFFWVATP